MFWDGDRPVANRTNKRGCRWWYQDGEGWGKVRQGQSNKATYNFQLKTTTTKCQETENRTSSQLYICQPI